MNKSLLIVLALIVLGVIAYLLLSKPQTPQVPQPEEVVDLTETMVTEDAVTVELLEQNDSGESGTAVLEEVGGKAVVTLNMTGAPEGVAQPAHIHAGVCPDVGAVVYPLEFPVDGESVTTLDVSFEDLRSQLPLGINVHKSTSEPSIYVSCGDLSL